jgi:hypothetical protein
VRSYAQIAAKPTLTKTTICRYEGSFFLLRHENDGLVNNGQPPRLVVYVPMSQGDMQNALIELEAAGVVMRPGKQPPNRNSKLAVESTLPIFIWTRSTCSRIACLARRASR